MLLRLIVAGLSTNSDLFACAAFLIYGLAFAFCFDVAFFNLNGLALLFLYRFAFGFPDGFANLVAAEDFTFTFWHPFALPVLDGFAFSFRHHLAVF